ncbi:arsenosugar biosynthesis radical SAM (seleno)protein ArsS [Methylomicrobium sp. Wu6]|uniref:arsenosugar biosynthesis radical SAM (seleno)protein ArsS n=1 Tax=Methylomicrobium sp. Wu6 TaxID=3107928 RepID=UPI002DD6456C|nr:arsenosugar biosynthesis radical SAM (seleno)protein ArsS [Methylomicrobium sp. Wu6]MEC4747216.1 arsenosugar biosynthesis radical SAM (seleno)protein ArsS [Methylomicrobium sp. Wu6]
MHATLPLLEQTDFPPLYRNELAVLQVNLGYLCNLSCTHCHVNAGPKRTELMDKETVGLVLAFIEKEAIKTLDLTGGAPEMNPHFRKLVTKARQLGVKVIDRCNLVILEEPGYEDLAEFLAANQVEITASLPCYLEDNVDRQRGKGTFQQSILALQSLNRLGYGQENGNLRLSLVFNPQGATLPPAQEPLEKAYKAHLRDDYGITFNQLFAMANLPIQRFGSMLVSKGLFNDYLQLLKDNHCAENLRYVMCLNTLSIDWQGYVYDCDFNQMLQLSLGAYADQKIHLKQLFGRTLTGAPISVRQHCYGCTAGQGSSCGGALI